MRILVLDDSKERHKIFKRNLIGNEVVCHAHTYNEAIEYLNEKVFDLIYLDHDLNLDGFQSISPDGKELTGNDVAKYIVSMDSSKYPQIVVIHSYNPTGAENIGSVLKAAQIKYIKSPFNDKIGL